ncbi:universal stress protein [Nocardioides astragali]|uniref:Universal stress protein n=1 Tax=Nocardioides astragali TaxID=1776736 RepID=A0ABW2NBM3_9ACTN|nr:universal stress protein [Nocardioides astragali]
MDTASVRPSSIVVGVDGSPSAAHALEWAVDQAAVEHRPLVLAHAVSHEEEGWLDRTGLDYQVGADVRRARGHELLGAARAKVEERDSGVEVHTALEITDPRHLLVGLSGAAAMLVLGSHGRGPVGSLVLGSVGVTLARGARCPLVIYRPADGMRARQGVLVGVDGARGLGEVLRFAFRQASLRRLPLTVQHSSWGPQASGVYPSDRPIDIERQRPLVAEEVAGLSEEFPDVRVRYAWAQGHPADCLVREGSRMDLLVVGRHEDGALSRIRHSSIATRVVEHARCPVAVVPISSP